MNILTLNKIDLKRLILRFNMNSEYNNIIAFVYNNMFINYNNIFLIIDNIVLMIITLNKNDIYKNNYYKCLNDDVNLYNKDINYLRLSNRHFKINDLFNNIIKSVINKNTNNLKRFNINNMSFDVLKDIKDFLLNNKDLYVLKCNDIIINHLNIKYTYYHNNNNVNIQLKTKGTKKYILIYYTTFDNNYIYIVSDLHLIKRLNKRCNYHKLKLNNYHKRLLLNDYDKKDFKNIDDIYNYADNFLDVQMIFEDLHTFDNFLDYKICLLSYRKKFIKPLKDFDKIKGCYDLQTNKKNSYSKTKNTILKYDKITNDLILNDINTIKDIIYLNYNNYYDLIGILNSLEHLNYYNKYLVKCLNDLIKYINDLILDIKINTNNHYDIKNSTLNDYDNYNYKLSDYFIYHNTKDKI